MTTLPEFLFFFGGLAYLALAFIVSLIRERRERRERRSGVSATEHAANERRLNPNIFRIEKP